MNRFFIIGNPRSGTTLFRLMLNKHSEITVPPEAGFLVWLHNEFGKSNFSNGYALLLNALKETNKIETWQLDFKELEKFLLQEKPTNFSHVMNKIYNFYSLHVLKKEVSIYGDKNNYYLEHIDLLSKIYPNAKFIHIIRDGRSVAASYKGVMQNKIDSKYAPNLPTNIEDIAKEWSNNINSIEKSFTKLSKDNIYIIRYEDLILNTEKELSYICNFLSISFEKKMLEYYKTSEQEGLEPQEYMAWKSKNLQPLKKDETEKYKQLEHAALIDFEKLTLNLLNKYKYK